MTLGALLRECARIGRRHRAPACSTAVKCAGVATFERRSDEMAREDQSELAQTRDFAASRRRRFGPSPTAGVGGHQSARRTHAICGLQFKLLVVLLAVFPLAAGAVVNFGFVDVYTASNPLPPFGASFDLRPAIAEDRSVVFSETYFTGTRLATRFVVVESDGTTRIVADETGSASFDMLGPDRPGISNDGRHVAFSAKHAGKTMILRRDLTNNGLALIAEQGEVVAGVGTLGKVDCGGACSVQNATMPAVAFDEPSTVLFHSAGSLLFGNGGEVSNWLTLSTKDLVGFKSFRQQENGLKAALVTGQTGLGAVITGSSFPDGVSAATCSNCLVAALRSATIEGTLGGLNSNTVTGYIADLVDGTSEIRLYEGPLSMATPVSDAGLLEGLDRLSITVDKALVFEAGMDVREQYAIFTGSDPIQDRVIGRGDVLFGQVVTDIALRDGDALTRFGNFAFGAKLADGSEHVVRSRTFGNFLSDTKAQAALPTGGTSLLSMTLDALPAGPLDLSFEVGFLAGTGELEVLLGGQSLGSFRAAGIPDERVIRVLDIDPRTLLDPLALAAPLDLSFLVRGDAGFALTLDDVALGSRGSGVSLLRNGDFETGYLDGWRIDVDGGATVFAKAVATTPAPAPGTAWLASGLLLVLAARHRRVRARSPQLHR